MGVIPQGGVRIATEGEMMGSGVWEAAKAHIIADHITVFIPCRRRRQLHCFALDQDLRGHAKHPCRQASVRGTAPGPGRNAQAPGGPSAPKVKSRPGRADWAQIR